METSLEPAFPARLRCFLNPIARLVSALANQCRNGPFHHRSGIFQIASEMVASRRTRTDRRFLCLSNIFDT